MSRRAPFARWLDDTNDVTQTFLSAGQIPGLVNLAGGLPDPSTWPAPELADFAGRAVADHTQDALGYSPIDGLPDLRDRIAADYSRSDLRLTRDNVLITTGGMQGLELLGKVLLNSGDTIAAQSPAYLGAIDAWKPRTPQYRAMVLEQNGFDPHGSMTGAQFAYTVPNFSNPSGRLVPVDQRRALVAAAQATGCWLAEDDPYGHLYYDAAPLPRMLDLSATGAPVYDGQVIYLGTFSKMLAPGLRVGWVIAAPAVITATTTAKQGSDMFTSGLCQRIALQAMEQGVPDRILPGILDLYRARRDALCAAMATDLSDLFTWEVPTGGMFVWAVARDPSLDTDRLMKTGLDHGVCVSPSSVFDPLGRDRRAIRVNFTLNPPEVLAEGVRRLADATRMELTRAA
ncbi:2-aminoadipate transaminase [Antarctobacter heliothermus]|uniref:2-aminoadipate transaminase n=1 Tax=Antarctobacter heliothermus TaxID=74033 RepID=A0A222E4Y5_9RHOB|nr:PLP-dependent aminotransferase family protein [Antarctobacter heliothermus]ASP21190.1 2-aminoadipate transaminase [Antarctobacter heliothermus]